MKEKMRLDRLLVERGYFPTREKAQAAIMAGLVKSGDQRLQKAGLSVDAAIELSVEGPSQPYVSRGGLKLAKALESFGVIPQSRIALNIGASTGGFTDVLLRSGADRVYAIDVGYGQLAWELRQNPQVVVWERTNVRHLTPEQLYPNGEDRASLAVIDVSFISLTIVLPPLGALLAPDSEIVALIKPQFEAGREKVSKGVVRNPDIHLEVIAKVLECALSLGWYPFGLTYSPIKGPEGNVEFLVHWKREAGDMDWRSLAQQVVLEAKKLA